MNSVDPGTKDDGHSKNVLYHEDALGSKEELFSGTAPRASGGKR